MTLRAIFTIHLTSNSTLKGKRGAVNRNSSITRDGVWRTRLARFFFLSLKFLFVFPLFIIPCFFLSSVVSYFLAYYFLNLTILFSFIYHFVFFIICVLFFGCLFPVNLSSYTQLSYQFYFLIDCLRNGYVKEISLFIIYYKCLCTDVYVTFRHSIILLDWK